jgi:hypothetical protein
MKNAALAIPILFLLTSCDPEATLYVLTHPDTWHDDSGGGGGSNSTWTARTLPSREDWTSVTYGDGVFVAVAWSNNAAATSPDGITWTASTLPSREDWISVTYGNSVFVAVGWCSNAAETTSP